MFRVAVSERFGWRTCLASFVFLLSCLDPSLCASEGIGLALSQQLNTPLHRSLATVKLDHEESAIHRLDAQGGTVDIHDRRPVVFTAADAAMWLDPAISNEQAAELARSMALSADSFAWYMVDKAVGSVRNQGAPLAEQALM